MTAKEQIIKMFRDNVKGQRPDVSGTNERHDGRTGQWLEHQFGVSSNASNMADLMGYELKNETTSKTTFGDWSANEYIFNQYEYSPIFSGNRAIDRRDKFLTIFGKPNAEKHGRYPILMFGLILSLIYINCVDVPVYKGLLNWTFGLLLALTFITATYFDNKYDDLDEQEAWRDML